MDSRYSFCTKINLSYVLVFSRSVLLFSHPYPNLGNPGFARRSGVSSSSEMHSF